MKYKYGVYRQGALIEEQDFDEIKTINYFCGLYGITLNEKIEAEIRSGEISEESMEVLCSELGIYVYAEDLCGICNKALSRYEREDLFTNDDGMKIGSDTVHAEQYARFVGSFDYWDKRKTTRNIDGEVMLLCFEVPFIWDIKSEELPKNAEDAAQKLSEAAKTLLRDDIDWKSRLGYLIGAEFAAE